MDPVERVCCPTRAIHTQLKYSKLKLKTKTLTKQVAIYSGAGISQLEWREVEGGQLPSPRYGPRAAMLDNILYVTGGYPGYPGSSLTSILSWEKRLQNDRKYAIFQNWLDTRPKMERHEPNV